MNRNLFIVTSYLHVFLADILIKHLKLNNVDIFTTKKFIHFFDSYKVEQYYFPGLNENRLSKLPKLIYNYIFSKNKFYDKVFIPNDADPFIQVLIRKNKFNELNFYEEGSTAYQKIQEQMNDHNKSRSLWLKKLLGLEETKLALSSKKISKAYVFLTDVLKKLRPDLEYIELSNIIKNYSQKETIHIDSIYKNVDFLIVTQPLTEDGYCCNNDEIEAIRIFIKENKNKKILLKRHPRESKYKYKQYLKEFDNVTILPEHYNEYPYQILHYSLLPKNIVSFFSSIMLTVDKTHDDFKRISLAKLLTTNESMTNILQNYKIYLNNFYIFELKR